MVAALKNKHTLAQTGFALTDVGFTYNGTLYRFEDVTETKIIRSVLEHKVVLVGSDYIHSISIMIGIRSGELLQVTEQPTWLSDSKLSNVEHIENMFSVISQKSWDNRVHKYINQVNDAGYFEYTGWRFYPKQGSIHDLKTNRSYKMNEVQLLKSYGFLAVKENNEGFGSKLVKGLVGGQIGISTLSDTDVFYALLKHYFGLSWR